MPRRLTVTLLPLLAAAGLILFFNCSDSTDPEPELDKPVTLTVTPNTGPPGTPLTVAGINPSQVDQGGLTVLVGGEAVPYHFDGGALKTAIPMLIG